MTRKPKKVYALSLLFVVSISVYILSTKLPFKSSIQTFPSTSANASRTRKKTLVLAYNEFFRHKDWMTVNEDCSIPRTREKPCVRDDFEFTSDKQRFYESDFVLVHAASDLSSLRHLKTMRRQKPASQLWIYYSMESPRLTPHTPLFGDMFDLTFTYRIDSDFWAPYGTYEEIPFVNLSHQDFSAGKDKLVSWMVSNCPPRLRKSFVRELQNYIAVDVFGRCSGQFGKSRSCSGGVTCTAIIKQYKFYLSFENALCEDYITEKYWGHLGRLCAVLFKTLVEILVTHMMDNLLSIYLGY